MGNRGAVFRRQGGHERYRLGHMPGIAADRAVHSQAAGGFDACGDQPLNCRNGYFRFTRQSLVTNFQIRITASKTRFEVT